MSLFKPSFNPLNRLNAISVGPKDRKTPSSILIGTCALLLTRTASRACAQARRARVRRVALRRLLRHQALLERVELRVLDVVGDVGAQHERTALLARCQTFAATGFNSQATWFGVK